METVLPFLLGGLLPGLSALKGRKDQQQQAEQEALIRQREEEAAKAERAFRQTLALGGKRQLTFAEGGGAPGLSKYLGGGS